MPREGGAIELQGRKFVLSCGVLRSREPLSEAQGQTGRIFAYKWAQRDTFELGPSRHMRSWLIEKYGDVCSAGWFAEHGDNPLLLDAGCGAAMSAIALFEPVLRRVRYLGVDVSEAVDVARARFAERGLEAGFFQAELSKIPLPDRSVDIVFAEGVLHHTDDTAAALGSLVRLLKPGGRILFYVYNRKGPIREFTDDYIRDQLARLTPEQGWAAIMPLTRLGKALGELNVEVEIPEAVDLLGIPAGRIDIQRLFYWHVFKVFYRPELTLEEMNHINFDWYAPRNASRHTVQEVREWCARLALVIERERVEEAGITVIARRT